MTYGELPSVVFKDGLLAGEDEAVNLLERSKGTRWITVMDDAAAYEAPVEGRLTLSWREGDELFEFICQQANYAPELMVNEDKQAIGRSSPIVP